jgi:exoribonuclease II
MPSIDHAKEIRSETVEKGKLIEFRQGSDRHLAVLDRPEGKKHWIALDARGHSQKLHPRDVSYELGGEGYGVEDIARIEAELADYLDPSALEVAWELLVEDQESTDPKGLAQLLFSDQGAVPCYAAHRLLCEDKLYFKQRKDHYEPRPIAQVEELKHQIAVEQERQVRWQSFLALVQQRLQANSDGTSEGCPSASWSPEELVYIESLERFAIFEQEAPNRTPALELLNALGRFENPAAAFELLVDLGRWSPHENLLVRRRQLPTTFPSKVLDVTPTDPQAALPDEDRDRRLNLTHLKVYTIDDESTREIDDGLSIEPLSDGRQQLWIHIADPTRWIRLGDEIDLEARRRGTTVYLPEQVIPMFPESLATGPMSLIQGELCCALSFRVLLDGDGAIADYSIHTSHIRPTYRLTYSDVDEMLELGVTEEPELAALHNAAQLRQRWRERQGSITIHLPESSIKVLGDDEIQIDVLDESQSRQLVAELMILTGEVAGRYGRDHGLPVPFRGQPQPELPSEAELMQLPAGPVRASAVRRCMPRSEVNLTPSRHASLALEVYTQATSPIRRYSDLIAHYQIKAHLRGGPLAFEAEELQALLQTLGPITYEAVLVERQTKNYWALEYLRRLGDKPWKVLMLRWLREHERLGLVMLEDLGIEQAVRFERLVPLGDRLTLRVTHVDPRRAEIRFQEVVEEEVA